MATTAHDERPLRADARRNRERLLAVATEVFAEQGLEVGVAEIARRAGVGSATLFRHFATKEELVGAVLESRFAAMEQLAEEMTREPDPWTALTSVMRAIVQMQAQDRGLMEALPMRLVSESQLDTHRRRMLGHIAPLLQRAQDAGAVRTDIVAEDMPFLVCAAGSAGCIIDLQRPELSERYLGVILDGLRPGSATPLPAAPPTAAEITAGLRRMSSDGA